MISIYLFFYSMDIFSEFIQQVVPDTHNTFYVLLILIAAIWTAGRIFSYFRIPTVLGEIIAGIIIGPAMLGLIPESEVVTVLGELGVFFIMFHSGLDTDIRKLAKSSKLAVLLALGGVSSLFILGGGVILLLGFPVMTAIFMGTVLSVTSFAAITRVLRDLKLSKTKIGQAVLGATVVDDVVGFVLLSIVITLVQTGNFSLIAIAVAVVKVFVFFGGTWLIGYEILPYFNRFLNTIGAKGFTFSIIVAFLFGYLAEVIGLHPILGAFLGGMFIRQEITNQEMFNKIEDRFFGLSYSFLGPIFFASIGMMINLSVFQENMVLNLGLIFLVLFGQWVGTGGMAYFFGHFNFRESTAIAAAAAPRGVMEIIIAKIGYDIFIKLSDGTQVRLITTELFSSVVVISLVVTIVSPFLIKVTLSKERMRELQYEA